MSDDVTGLDHGAIETVWTAGVERIVNTPAELDALPKDCILIDARDQRWTMPTAFSQPNAIASHRKALLARLPLKVDRHPDDRMIRANAKHLVALDVEVRRLRAALAVRPAVAATPSELPDSAALGVVDDRVAEAVAAERERATRILRAVAAEPWDQPLVGAALSKAELMITEQPPFNAARIARSGAGL